MKKFLKNPLAILAVLVIAMFVIGEKYHYENRLSLMFLQKKCIHISIL